MPLTLSSSNIIVDYGDENYIVDTAKTIINYNEYIELPIVTLQDNIRDIYDEKQFPTNPPTGLPAVYTNKLQTFNFNLSSVIDSTGYSTYADDINVSTYNNSDTIVGFSQYIQGILYEFRTNHCGESNGRWYAVLNNDLTKNWYIQYYNWVLSKTYSEYAYNNTDTTLLTDGTLYRGIWLEIGSTDKMILTKYSWSMSDSDANRNIRKPFIWLVCGSNDRIIWYPIHNVPNDLLIPDTIPSYPPNITDIFFKNFDKPPAFKYFRWIINSLFSDTWFAVSSFKLYGYKYKEEPQIFDDDNYRYIILRNLGNNQTKYTIEFKETTLCDFLMVAGGGGGGTNYLFNSSVPGSGGGAGGIIFLENQTIEAGTYDIYVGNGGDGDKYYQDDAPKRGKNGFNTSFSYLQTEAIGGGGGASLGGYSIAGNGGSGGGGSWLDGPSQTDTSYMIGGTGTSTNILKFDGTIIKTNYIQGYSGGTTLNGSASTNDPYASGGGGANQIGYSNDLEAVIDGNGGSGKYDSIGDGNGKNFKTFFNITDKSIGHHINGNVYFGGGGSTGYCIPTKNISSGGYGGGGSSNEGDGVNGLPNTGGGGSGGSSTTTNIRYNGGNGGSGIFIIRCSKVKQNVDYMVQWTYDTENPNSYILGNVGIGTTANDKYALNILGNINCDNLYKNGRKIQTGKKKLIDKKKEANKLYPYELYTPIRMYPPVRNLLSPIFAVKNQSYGNGVYETWESSYLALVSEWKAFSAFKSSDITGYHGGSNQYNDGTYDNTNYIKLDYKGDWLKIKLPYPIIMTKYGFKTRTGFNNRAPGQFIIYASNDNNNWTELVRKTQTIEYVSGVFIENITNNIFYNYYAVVVNKLLGSETVLNFDEWYIYGKEISVSNNDTFISNIYNNQIVKEYTILSNNSNNLKLWYKFNNENIIGFDSNTGNPIKHHLINLYTLSTYGIVNKCALFNNNSMLISKTINFNSLVGQAFTISLWVKILPGISQYGQILHFNDLSNGDGLNIRRSNSDNIEFFLCQGGTQNKLFTLTSPIYILNIWVHYTLTYNNTGANLYINGQLFQTISIATTNTLQNINIIFGNKSDGSQQFYGNIEDFRLYNRVLNNTEINAIAYNKILSNNNYILQTKPTNIKYPYLECDDNNLVAWYKLNGDNKDSSRNNFKLNNYFGGMLFNLHSDNPLYTSVAISTAEANRNWALTDNINKNVPISFAFWFKVTGKSYYTIMGYGNYPSPSIQFDYTYSNKTLTIYTALNNQWNVSPSFSPIYDNIWYHLVYTLSNENPVITKLYINGKFIVAGIGLKNCTLRSFNNLAVANSGDNGRGFEGHLADLRIYDKVLNNSEIKLLYDGKIHNDYKLLTFNYNYIYDMQIKAESITGFSGWLLVKYKPVSPYWWSGNDNLQGKFKLNEYTRLSTEEWAMSWDDNYYNEILFVKGEDFTSWLHINSTHLDLYNWQDKPAIGGNKLTNGLFKYYRDADNGEFGGQSQSPYIFDHQVSNYNNATGHLIYQEYSERGFNNVPGNNWPDSNYVKYKPEDYNYYIFVRNSSDNNTITPDHTEYKLTIPKKLNCDILLVGGGGGGGKYGGGGGGGDVQYFNNIFLEPAEYTIKVGRGGNGSRLYDNNQNSTNGSNTELYINNTLLYIAAGGGGGTSWNGGDYGGIDPVINYSALNNNSSGGGGGGAASYTTINSGNSIVSTYSGNGGSGGTNSNNINGDIICVAAGGGGGGGVLGENGENAYMLTSSIKDSISGNGGNGTQCDITGMPKFYGGGGGGGGSSMFGNVNAIKRYIVKDGIGGLGGSGNGGIIGNNINNKYSNFATFNTGGGGGGGGGGINNNNGGNGGSGILIIKYKAEYEIISQNLLEWTYNTYNNVVKYNGNVGIGTTIAESSLDVNGTITGFSKNFKIQHPIISDKILYHGSIEGPRYDNIYRGKTTIKNGEAKVIIDYECNDTGGMTYGTFNLLNKNPQLYLQNNNTYDNVKGKIIDGIVTIESNNIKDNIEVEWLVVAERCDKSLIKSIITDEYGSLVCEHSKNIPCGTYNNNVETPQLGLFWENVGTIFPIKGILLVNKELSIALETKTNFTEEEWLFFNIQGLRLNHCVKSQNNYFKPIKC